MYALKAKYRHQQLGAQHTCDTVHPPSDCTVPRRCQRGRQKVSKVRWWYTIEVSKLAWTVVLSAVTKGVRPPGENGAGIRRPAKGCKSFNTSADRRTTHRHEENGWRIDLLATITATINRRFDDVINCQKGGPRNQTVRQCVSLMMRGPSTLLMDLSEEHASYA